MHAYRDVGGRAASETEAEVVERRREQAAEGVPIPLLWRGARQGGVVAPRLEPAADAYTDVGGRAASGTSGREKSWIDLFRTS